MKIMKYSMLILAASFIQQANAEVKNATLTLDPLQVQLNAGDVLLVKYNLNHRPTRPGSVYSLHCSAKGSVEMEYTLEGLTKQANLPKTFDFYHNENAGIDTEGEFKLKMPSTGDSDTIVCEMYN